MVWSVAKVSGVSLATMLVAPPALGGPQAASPPGAARGQPSAPASAPAPRLDAFAQHVLERTGYGPDGWSVGRIAQLGAEAYIEEQLHPQTIDDSAFEARLAGYASLSMSWEELRDNYCSSCETGPANQPRWELREAKLLRSIYSRRQLEAVLTDFWFDHFNLDGSKGFARWGLVPMERDAIRPHVLGRFEDMLLATARSPGMLSYLDNMHSYVDGYVDGNGVVHGLNENYARELCELHTLGVNGGYTQDDVIEVARIMTGWSIRISSGFFYKDHIHDQGPKLFMGVLSIPANGGMDDGLTLISFLASHPATANRISRLLCERFVSEDAPPALVQAGADTFLATGGDLREVMRVILFSPEFEARPYRTKVKRPLVFLASAARALGAASMESSLERLHEDLKALGEVLYEADQPVGYPDASEHWAGEGTLLARFNAVEAMVYEPTAGIDLGVADGTASEIVDALITRLRRRHVSPATRAAIEAHLDAMPAAPAADRVGDAAALILSSPRFLRH